MSNAYVLPYGHHAQPLRFTPCFSPFTCYPLRFQAHRDRDREFRPFADFTLDPDIAAHQIDKSFDDRQTQTRAAVPPRTRHVRLAELVEDVIQRLWFHADAGIGNGELYVAVFLPRRHLDFPSLGELRGIA